MCVFSPLLLIICDDIFWHPVSYTDHQTFQKKDDIWWRPVIWSAADMQFPVDIVVPESWPLQFWCWVFFLNFRHFFVFFGWWFIVSFSLLATGTSMLYRHTLVIDNSLHTSRNIRRAPTVSIAAMMCVCSALVLTICDVIWRPPVVWSTAECLHVFGAQYALEYMVRTSCSSWLIRKSFDVQ